MMMNYKIKRFFSQVHSTNSVWWSNRDGICFLFKTTFSSNSSELCKGAKILSFTHVVVPNSSLELFAQKIDNTRYLYLHFCTISRVYLPPGLVKLSIVFPVKPIEIVIAQNESYRLKEIELMNFENLPAQINHLQSLENFQCKSTPVYELDFKLFAKMDNLTILQMVKTSTTDVVFSKLRQFHLLRMFIFCRSHLSTLNATSWNFPSLEELDLSYNHFTILPQQIATFGNLIRLSMRHNQLEYIDMSIFAGLRRLAILDLQGNQISSITGELKLPMLTNLRLEANRLGELDVSQWYLPALTRISLGSNFLKSVVNFTKCFSGAIFIELHEGQWDCNWLKEIGHLIRGMIIGSIQQNSSIQHCYALRYSMTESSIVEMYVNGTTQRHPL